MFTVDEIKNIKNAFNDLKSPENLPFSYIDEKFNKVIKKDNTNFKTFCPNYCHVDYNAVIGWEGQSYHYAYKEGFFSIAHLAILPAKHLSDSLVYPIIYNYRQYLELVLKENILRFQIFFRLPITNTKTHDLKFLLNTLIDILDSFNLGFLISSIQKKVILDFHEIDENNDAFRFVYDRQGDLNHRYDHKQINLLNLHYTMNEIYNDFNAIDYLFEPNSYFDDRTLSPIYQSFIVAFHEFLSLKRNKNGINSFNKLKSVILNFEHQLSSEMKFRFEESSIVQLSNTVYETTLNELGLTIIITVNNEIIDSIQIK
ncbi:hypothetical protein P5408_010495 [Bacillus subtilis]|nr:hypothetical protein [Bacillus subtilis]